MEFCLIKCGWSIYGDIHEYCTYIVYIHVNIDVTKKAYNDQTRDQYGFL